MNKCKWLCDGVCCNDKCDYLADYQPHKCESIEECKWFEKEDELGDEYNDRDKTNF